jgi:uncharacterized protein YbjT (DUF2867 family)
VRYRYAGSRIHHRSGADRPDCGLPSWAPPVRQTRGMGRTVLVSGASGFVGSHLTASLGERGYDLRAMTRRPGDYRGPGRPVRGDVADPASLSAALSGVHAAYYLVHSLGRADFAAKDVQGAINFADACARAGLERIIYLGGLGQDDGALSPHLRSRREVEQQLRSGPVPVTVLRAALVIGHGSIVWEITRQLVDHLPIVITPRWVNTRTQPIAVTDVVRYLVGVLEPDQARGATYEIGGAEVLRYVDMLQRTAEVQGRRLPSLSVPLLTPRLSAMWLALVTDVDTATADNLVDSMTNEMVVREHAIRDLVPGDVLGFNESARHALAECAKAPRRSHTGAGR